MVVNHHRNQSKRCVTNEIPMRPRKCIMSSIANIVTCRIGRKLEFVWFFIGLNASVILIQSLTQSID